jgi:quercetin dioxygenase-like cupin family protein
MHEQTQAAARALIWDQTPSTEVYPGITRQTIVSGGATLTRYIYAPGCVFPVHQHPDEQITVVHSGEIEFTVNGAPLTLRAGAVALIPGNVPHGARVVAGETVVTDNYFPSANRAPLELRDS